MPVGLSRLLVVVVFLRLVMPVTLIGSALIFEHFLASDYQTSLLALDQTNAELKKLNGDTSSPTAPHAAVPPASTAEPSPDKKGLLAGAMEALTNAKVAVVSAKDKMADAMDVSAAKVQAKFEKVQAMAERTAERVITLIVVFLMQTIVVPLILLLVLYRLLGELVPPSRRSGHFDVH